MALETRERFANFPRGYPQLRTSSYIYRGVKHEGNAGGSLFFFNARLFGFVWVK